jgi:hypothetical protein
VRGYGNLTLDEQFAREDAIRHKIRVRTTRRQGDKNFIESQKPQEQRILSNAKAKQVEDERIREIEYSNRKLFKRIRDIEVKPLPAHLDPYKLDDVVPNHLHVGRINTKTRHLQAIQDENVKMLRRLQEAPSTYKF